MFCLTIKLSGVEMKGNTEIKEFTVIQVIFVDIIIYNI